ncbi:hypothetical protein APHWI1_0936 [Anaplasma phagocytophilum str. ApWI1]|uniref:Uncharacterized protein n=1 Tax=Anaplasma phagocytophilum str. ApWI1 TaxID=1359155 RepID=A0A0F3PZI6_ANAPH|nr:hypothetical protein APHWI1_0936 [Anaplasma phagocytophilum str. ApWI1]KJV99737.1 hypothetical protein OTSANNIE_0112 [Anaplasma phagocytophilum str. Annie]
MANAITSPKESCVVTFKCESIVHGFAQRSCSHTVQKGMFYYPP